MTQNQKMFIEAQSWKLENMNSLPYNPEDQLRKLSMAESSAQIFKAMESSQNTLEPWITPTEKKSTSCQFKRKLRNNNKISAEGIRCQSERNKRKIGVLGPLDNYDKKSHTFIIRSKERSRPRNLNSMSIQEALNFRINSQRKTCAISTIDSIREQDILNTGKLRKTSEQLLLAQLSNQQEFIPLKKAYQEVRKIQMANLSDFYSSAKYEFAFKPVEAFIYPISLNNIGQRQYRKENKKMGRFELFVNSKKINQEKRGRKFSLKKI